MPALPERPVHVGSDTSECNRSCCDWRKASAALAARVAACSRAHGLASAASSPPHRGQAQPGAHEHTENEPNVRAKHRLQSMKGA